MHKDSQKPSRGGTEKLLKTSVVKNKMAEDDYNDG